MKMMSSSRKSSSELVGGWGRKMGLLLVFFHTDEEEEEGEHNKPILPLSSSSLIKRTNSSSSSHLLLHKAQSTISICLLLLFTTLLLFTLSTLPNNSSSSSSTIRRHLTSTSTSTSAHNDHHHVHALQGMGTLYSRGSRAMSNLIVAHAVESLTLHDLKLFVRLIYRSGLTSTSDLLFLFPSTATTSLDTAIQQETESFLKLLTLYTLNLNNNNTSSLSLDPNRFFRTSKKKDNSGEPIWGRRSRSNFSEAELTRRPSYGSVIGFDAEELDPENALSGFMDVVKVPMSLRRWACYPMLLGRVRRNFKHVVLVDMKEVLVLGGDDQLIRSQSPESVLVMNIMKHGKRVDPGIIRGGLRGVRRLSNAMLTAIVRASTLMKQHKRKRSSVGVTESGVLNQIVGNEFALKNINVNLMVSDESLPELVGTRLFAHMKKNNNNNHHSTVIRRGGNSNSGVISSVVMKHICSFPLDSQVYSEC